MSKLSFQDYYNENFSYCYRCGKLNENGFKLKSYWEGEHTIAHFKPKPYHTGGYPGFVYGGLIAAILDCHGNGTAAAAAYKAENRGHDTLPNIRFVTASLNINFLKPTPMGKVLDLRGDILEVTNKKVIMKLSVSVEGNTTVEATMVAVRIPEKNNK